MGDIAEIFKTLTPVLSTNLMPDEVKIKTRFLPSYSWRPGPKGKTNFLYKLLHPRIYLVKLNQAWKLDPLAGEYFKPVSMKEVEAESKFTILDFIAFGFLSYGVYKAVKVFLPGLTKK